MSSFRPACMQSGLIMANVSCTSSSWGPTPPVNNTSPASEQMGKGAEGKTHRTGMVLVRWQPHLGRERSRGPAFDLVSAASVRCLQQSPPPNTMEYTRAGAARERRRDRDIDDMPWWSPTKLNTNATARIAPLIVFDHD